MEREPHEAGTNLAPERVVPAPDAVWRNQRDQFFLKEARPTARLMIGANVLVQAMVIATLVPADYPVWRVCAFVSLFVAFAVGHRLILARTRETQRVEHAFIGMNVTAQLFVVGSCCLTGGVHSPLLPGTVMPAIV